MGCLRLTFCVCDRVFGAGHEVPYYQPAVALQVFKQTMGQQALSST